MKKLIYHWVDSKGDTVSIPEDRNNWRITFNGKPSISHTVYKTVLGKLTAKTYAPNEVMHIAKGINYYVHRNNLHPEAFKTETVLREVDINRLRATFELHAQLGHFLVATEVERYCQ